MRKVRPETSAHWVEGQPATNEGNDSARFPAQRPRWKISGNGNRLADGLAAGLSAAPCGALKQSRGQGERRDRPQANGPQATAASGWAPSPPPRLLAAHHQGSPPPIHPGAATSKFASRRLAGPPTHRPSLLTATHPVFVLYRAGDRPPIRTHVTSTPPSQQSGRLSPRVSPPLLPYRSSLSSSLSSCSCNEPKATQKQPQLRHSTVQLAGGRPADQNVARPARPD